ncbi:MAG: hypothetical protein AB2L09_08395 [Coriobacteriia bacterium]
MFADSQSDFVAYFQAPHVRRLRYMTSVLVILPMAAVVFPSLSFPLMPIFLLGLLCMSVVWIAVAVRDRSALPADAPRDARLARTAVIIGSTVMLAGFSIVAVLLYIG